MRVEEATMNLAGANQMKLERKMKDEHSLPSGADPDENPPLSFDFLYYTHEIDTRAFHYRNYPQ